jgi:hypothetical protein
VTNENVGNVPDPVHYHDYGDSYYGDNNGDDSNDVSGHTDDDKDGVEDGGEMDWGSPADSELLRVNKVAKKRTDPVKRRHDSPVSRGPKKLKLVRRTLNFVNDGGSKAVDDHKTPSSISESVPSNLNAPKKKVQKKSTLSRLGRKHPEADVIVVS